MGSKMDGPDGPPILRLMLAFFAFLYPLEDQCTNHGCNNGSSRCDKRFPQLHRQVPVYRSVFHLYHTSFCINYTILNVQGSMSKPGGE